MIKPFKLDNLKKVSQHEVELIRALYEFLPATDVRDKLDVAIRKSLMKHLGQDIRYFIMSCEMIGFSEIISSFPEVPILVTLGLTPIERRAIVQVDHHIANVIINKLLSGDNTASEMKTITETEQGVLQYLVMQVLEQIYLATGAETRVHFRFDKFLFDAVEVKKIIAPHERVCVLTLQVSIGEQSGFVKLVFPDPFVEEMLSMKSGAVWTKGERKYFLNELKHLGFIKTSVWAEAGKSLLSPVEIKDLEAGDVVLFDETDLSIKGKKISGKLTIHFGEAEKCVEAEISEMPGQNIKCKLGNFIK